MYSRFFPRPSRSWTTIIAQSTSIRSLKPNMAMTPKKALEWTEATMARLFCNEIRWVRARSDYGTFDKVFANYVKKTP
ncbi:MAG: hypothetical protein AB1847_03300 [bacterium]